MSYSNVLTLSLVTVVKVDTPCAVCGHSWIAFVPARRSVKWIHAMCVHCGRKALAGLDEDDAVDQWNKCNGPDAFRKKRSV